MPNNYDPAAIAERRRKVVLACRGIGFTDAETVQMFDLAVHAADLCVDVLTRASSMSISPVSTISVAVEMLKDFSKQLEAQFAKEAVEAIGAEAVDRATQEVEAHVEALKASNWGAH